MPVSDGGGARLRGRRPLSFRGLVGVTLAVLMSAIVGAACGTPESTSETVVARNYLQGKSAWAVTIDNAIAPWDAERALCLRVTGTSVPYYASNFCGFDNAIVYGEGAWYETTPLNDRFTLLIGPAPLRASRFVVQYRTHLYRVRHRKLVPTVCRGPVFRRSVPTVKLPPGTEVGRWFQVVLPTANADCVVNARLIDRRARPVDPRQF